MNLTGIPFEEYKSKQSIKFPSNSSIQILDLTLILYHRILAMIVFRVIVLMLDGLRPIGRDQTTRYHPKMSIQECCNLGFARLFIYLLFLCNMFLPYGHDHLLLREGPPKRALVFRKSPKYGGRGGVKVPNFGLENLLGAFPDSEA